MKTTQLSKGMYEQDTIAAISTPAGAGAIAMLRLSGEKALVVIDWIAPTLPLEPLPT